MYSLIWLSMHICRYCAINRVAKRSSREGSFWVERHRGTYSNRKASRTGDRVEYHLAWLCVGREGNSKRRHKAAYEGGCPRGLKTPFTQSLPIIFSSGTWPLAHVDATFNSMTPIMFTKDYLPELATHHSRPVRVSHGFLPLTQSIFSLKSSAEMSSALLVTW